MEVRPRLDGADCPTLGSEGSPLCSCWIAVAEQNHGHEDGSADFLGVSNTE